MYNNGKNNKNDTIEKSKEQVPILEYRTQILRIPRFQVGDYARVRDRRKNIPKVTKQNGKKRIFQNPKVELNSTITEKP